MSVLWYAAYSSGDSLCVTMANDWGSSSKDARRSWEFGSHRMPRNLRLVGPPGSRRQGLQRGDQDAGETPALREARTHRYVCRPRQTSRSAGVPPALLDRAALRCSRNIPSQTRSHPVKERGKQLKFRGIWVAPARWILAPVADREARSSAAHRKIRFMG